MTVLAPAQVPFPMETPLLADTPSANRLLDEIKSNTGRGDVFLTSIGDDS